VKAQHYFSKAIKDNDYRGKALSLVTDFSQDFIKDTYSLHNKPKQRTDDIERYALALAGRFSGKTLDMLGITPFVFDEEFTAKTDQPVFTMLGQKFENLQVYTGNIAGSIIYKGKAFNINCRFGDTFLAYMIASASGFLAVENLGAMSKQAGMAEWIFVYLWKLQLKKAFSLGLYKSYAEKSANLLNVRGSIDINSWMKKTAFDGKTRCNFKEHSYVNLVNTAIWMAMTKVYKSKYTSLVSDVYAIKNAFDSIGLSRVPLNVLRGLKVSNPYYKKYEDVAALSLLYLEGKFSSIGDTNPDFDAFLFDISLLFEHHCRKLLKERFKLLSRDAEFKVPNGVGFNDVLPDVVIHHGGNKISLFDVKYKHFNTSWDGGVERTDRFQLISYISLYLSKYEIVECGVIYPVPETSYKMFKPQTLDVAGLAIPFRVILYQVATDINDQGKLDDTFRSSFWKADSYFLD
jgi:5-methylcytosine-specific restriction endonuclease McrBC regulatory subunit McrC